MTRIYFAGRTSGNPTLDTLHSEGGCRVLESYAHLLKVHETLARPEFDLFLDSGAFSAFNSGTTIDIDQLIQDALKWKPKVVASLDVIGDADATLANSDYMRAAGVPVVPAFHYDSPLESLHTMCDGYSYIALGGLVPIAASKPKMKYWLDKCWSVIKQHWPIRVHGFGVNQLWILERYPWYSVDATTWMGPGQYGTTLKPTKGCYLPMQKYSAEQARKAASESLDWTVNNIGEGDLQTRLGASVRMMVARERHLMNLWRTRGLLDQQGEPQ